MEVSECEGGVVDDGVTEGLWGAKAEGADTGVRGVGGGGERKTTVEDEEGGGGEEVEKVSVTVSGEGGRLWGRLMIRISVTGSG